MKAWLPYPPERIGQLPGGIDIDVYDGLGEPPDSIGDVEFYVLPYTWNWDETVPLVARMPKLRVLQLLTAGYDHVLAYLRDSCLRDGVTLCNAQGVHDASTAELAVALTLASLRGIPRFARAHLTGEWTFDFYDALADRTVLIVGYGGVGKAIERRLAGFEVDVLRIARTAREGVHSIDELPDLLPDADVMILAVPLTDETRGLVNAGLLRQMKDGALLVNVARGPVVDTTALLAEAGRVRAALDVTDPEPLPPDHPLWQAPGVLISPHVGGSSSAFPPRALRLIAAQLHRYAAGESLENVVRVT
jgi:phosphoglycerate dehydrogenase-like enzyme